MAIRRRRRSADPAEGDLPAAPAAGATTTTVEPRRPDPGRRAGGDEAERSGGRRVRNRPALSLRDAWPVLLTQAAHPKQALLTAGGLAAAAALAERPGREVAVVLATALVGQVVLGWHNDLVDRRRDAQHRTPGKPVADGRLAAETVWFSMAVAVLLLVPLAVATGVTAGSCYLLSVAIGMLANVVLRRGVLSWLPWAVAFALYPAYLSYGGWGGSAEGSAPVVAMTVLAGLLGIGVHVLRAVFGLVADNEDGWTYLPLRLGLRLGATRLLALSTAFVVAVLVAMAAVGSSVGLST